MMVHAMNMTVLFFVVSAAILLVSFYVIELTTKYKDWEELKKGNLSVAIATGGKLLGIANILRFAISSNDSLVDTIVWGVTGLILLIVIYFLFNLFTPKFDIDKAIAEDNRAIAVLSAFISIAFSYIIGASIT
jgi:putative membrane protein